MKSINCFLSLCWGKTFCWQGFIS